jgi:hypothetical protein
MSGDSMIINNFKFCVYVQMYVYNLYGGIDVGNALGKMLFRLHVYMLIILFIDDLYIFPLIFTCDNIYYYIMILFKQFYWLSCCHLTFRKIWYCMHLYFHVYLESTSRKEGHNWQLAHLENHSDMPMFTSYLDTIPDMN